MPVLASRLIFNCSTLVRSFETYKTIKFTHRIRKEAIKIATKQGFSRQNTSHAEQQQNKQTAKPQYNSTATSVNSC